MNVRDVMETEFVTVYQDATYKQTAEALIGAGAGYVFVLDAADGLVGLVSESDLFRVLFPFYGSYYLNPELYTDPTEREYKIEEVQGHAVTRFMCRDMHTTTPDAPIMRAGATMLAKKIHRMPVVEGNRLVGVVTRHAIYAALYDKHLRAGQDAPSPAVE